ncbi:MAG: response regulator [Desulfobulbaceae bacterium]|nr:MAG: response regulator [Desulfobulbaceae bacterium]
MSFPCDTGQENVTGKKIPAAAAAGGKELSSDAAAQRLAAVSSDGRGQTVLIVEDDEAILKMTEHMLQNLGYTVLSASSPGKALSIASEHPSTLELLLSDVIMPEMNGLELADKVITLHPRIKCLFMSGYSDNVIAGKELAERKLHLINKPFTAKKLAAKIDELFEQGPDAVIPAE